MTAADQKYAQPSFQDRPAFQGQMLQGELAPKEQQAPIVLVRGSLGCLPLSSVKKLAAVTMKRGRYISREELDRIINSLTD